MAIAERGTATQASALSGADLTINVPTGVQDGDVMIAFLRCGTAALTMPALTGWTSLDIFNTAGQNPSGRSYFRIASSEPASYTWATSSLTVATAGSIIAYSGTDATTPINQHGAFNRQASNSAPAANSITSTVDGCKILYIVGSPGSMGTFTPPAGYTNESPGTISTIFLADIDQASQGATGTATATITSAAATIAQLVALAPSAAAAAPVNTVAPAVTGTATVGQTLSTTNGTWTGSPTSFTYQWQRDNTGGGTYSNIGSATANSYTLVDADDACNIRCVVTGTNTQGNASANSNAVGPVAEPVPANSVAPVASGTATVGQVVSSTTGTWTHQGGTIATYAYQWQDSADGSTGWANITGKTSSTYTIGSGENTKYLRCNVTATNTGGTSSATSSNVLGPVTTGSTQKRPIESFAYQTSVYRRDTDVASTDAAVTALPSLFIDSGGAKTATTSFVFFDTTLGRTRSIWAGDQVAVTDNAYIAAPGDFT